MEETEVPLEQAHEDMHHHAQHSKEGWISGAALSSAALAALAAVTALLSGHHANEAMMEQIEKSDIWGYYQANSIKALIVKSKDDSFEASGKKPPEGDEKKIEKYEEKKTELEKEARALEKSLKQHLECHLTFARGVTFFQVGIAITAVAVLSKKKEFWVVGLVFGAAGVVYFVLGLLPWIKELMGSTGAH